MLFQLFIPWYLQKAQNFVLIFICMRVNKKDTEREQERERERKRKRRILSVDLLPKSHNDQCGLNWNSASGTRQDCLREWKDPSIWPSSITSMTYLCWKLGQKQVRTSISGTHIFSLKKPSRESISVDSV